MRQLCLLLFLLFFSAHAARFNINFTGTQESKLEFSGPFTIGVMEGDSSAVLPGSPVASSDSRLNLVNGIVINQLFDYRAEPSEAEFQTEWLLKVEIPYGAPAVTVNYSLEVNESLDPDERIYLDGQDMANLTGNQLGPFTFDSANSGTTVHEIKVKYVKDPELINITPSVGSVLVPVSPVTVTELNWSLTSQSGSNDLSGLSQSFSGSTANNLIENVPVGTYILSYKFTEGSDGEILYNLPSPVPVTVSADTQSVMNTILTEKNGGIDFSSLNVELSNAGDQSTVITLAPVNPSLADVDVTFQLSEKLAGKVFIEDESGSSITGLKFTRGSSESRKIVLSAPLITESLAGSLNFTSTSTDTRFNTETSASVSLNFEAFIPQVKILSVNESSETGDTVVEYNVSRDDSYSRMQHGVMWGFSVEEAKMGVTRTDGRSDMVVNLPLSYYGSNTIYILAFAQTESGRFYFSEPVAYVPRPMVTINFTDQSCSWTGSGSWRNGSTRTFTLSLPDGYYLHSVTPASENLTYDCMGNIELADVRENQTLMVELRPVIEIKTVEEFFSIGRNEDYPVYAYFQLQNDLDFSVVNKYMPIEKFAGVLDGAGYALVNLSAAENGFCIENSGTIMNLGFVDVKLTGEAPSGICQVNLGEISSCYVVGTISGNKVSGLVNNNKGTVSSCFTNANISGVSCSGLVSTNSGTVSDCFSSSMFSLENYDGNKISHAGFVLLNEGTVSKAYALSHFKDAVEGAVRPFCISNSGTVNLCYYSSEFSKVSDDWAVDLTQEQFLHRATFPSFDFVELWKMDDRFSIPYLRNLPAYYMTLFNPSPLSDETQVAFALKGVHPVPPKFYCENDQQQFKEWRKAESLNLFKPLEVSAEFVKRRYKVCFELGECGTRVGGGQLRQSLTWGDTPLEPLVETSCGVEFIGWDKQLSAVDGNIIFTAQYTEISTDIITAGRMIDSKSMGVSISVSLGEDCQEGYFIEEQLSAGVSAGSISKSGTFSHESNIVTWGPFNRPVTVTYKLLPSKSQLIDLSGQVRVDQNTILVSGQSQIDFVDANNNSVNDVWESKILNAIEEVAEFEPEGDYDGDGLSNIFEYQNGTDPLGFSLEVHPKWNLICIPSDFNPFSVSFEAVFPYMISRPWSWNRESDKYDGLLKMEPGCAFWLNWGSSKDFISFPGEKVQNKPISLYRGWNMIGSSVYGRLVYNLGENFPAWVWEADTQSYRQVSTDNLKPGVGYWIFSQYKQNAIIEEN